MIPFHKAVNLFLLLIALFGFTFEPVYSQDSIPQNNDSRSWSFAKYLFKNSLHRSTLYELAILKKSPNSTFPADSLALLELKCYLSRKEEHYPKKVIPPALLKSANTDLKEWVWVYRSYGGLFPTSIHGAPIQLTPPPRESPISKLLFSTSKLLRIPNNNITISDLPQNLGPYQEDMDAIWNHYVHFLSKKKKSPLLTGVLSTFLPGTGNFYLGELGSGLSTIYIIGSMSLQAWEGYRKGGLKNPVFIGFTGMAGLFYFSNLFGTIRRAKNYNVKIYSNFKNQVFIDLSIPIRNWLQK